jgi:hypothetical protein
MTAVVPVERQSIHPAACLRVGRIERGVCQLLAILGPLIGQPDSLFFPC